MTVLAPENCIRPTGCGTCRCCEEGFCICGGHTQCSCPPCLVGRAEEVDVAALEAEMGYRVGSVYKHRFLGSDRYPWALVTCLAVSPDEDGPIVVLREADGTVTETGIPRDPRYFVEVQRGEALGAAGGSGVAGSAR